jgi:cephalosporin-C deacetylase-like acetyl esterase
MKVRKLWVFAGILWMAGCGSNPGETTPAGSSTDSRQQIVKNLVSEAQRITDRAVAELSSKDRWESVRAERRREMLDMLGLDPVPDRTPLNVQITGRIDKDDYFIEKVAFESLPQVYVTSNLYIPKKGKPPYPVVIYVCGHAFSPHGNKASYQRHPITFARHGYASLIIDSIQVAETFALHHGILNNEMYDWYSRGYTAAGLEVWNVIRGIDYLETRGEVDAQRVGITGRSGGAAMSWFSAAVDDRIKVIVPVMGNSTYAANVRADTQRHHCDCMFPINTYMQDMTHQGGLIAPRPLLMAHGSLDVLFPVEGYEEFEEVVGGLYEQYDGSDRFANIVVETTHQDSDFLRAEALKWFDRWLMGIPEREIDTSVEEVAAEELAVFGGDPPEDARNYRVHEFFNATPEPGNYSRPEQWQARRDEVASLLRERVFRAFPDEPGQVKVSLGGNDVPQGWQAWSLETEQGINVEAIYRQGTSEAPALFYVASAGEDLASVLATLRQTTNTDRNPLFIVYPRGVSTLSWDKGFWKSTLRNAMHVGRTVDSMRLWDVIRALQVLKEKTASPIVVAGIGSAGILGLYAAVLDEDIEQVILIKAPTSHRDGPVFLNVLRYTDLPEVAAMLAPRRLTFYGQMPEGFDFTRGIFELMGVPDHVSLSMSIDAALNGRHGHDFASGL